MNRIKILKDETVRLISAGEVIYSPIEVIKELIDNSLDSEADNIIIKIENCGKNLIEIEDNGYGIVKEDLLLTTDKHTTSKILSEDLSDIRHFGFRGEALYSISSVSKFCIESNHIQNINSGWKLSIDPITKNKIITKSAILKGTKTSVRDLFYNFPVKAKFMDKDQKILLHIKDLINKFAAIHYRKRFLLIHDGKKVYDYMPGIWLKRLMSIRSLGKNFVDNALLLDNEYSGMKIHGYISLPTFNARTRSNIFCYVNGRIVKDDNLYMSIRIAYEDLIPKGRHPYIVINISVPFSELDVNIHPNKLQIQFMRKSEVMRFIIGNIRDLLHSNSNKISSDINEKAFNYFVPSSALDKKNAQVFGNFMSDLKDFNNKELNIKQPERIDKITKKKDSLNKKEFDSVLNFSNVINDHKSIDNTKDLSVQEDFGKPIGQIYSNYIITQNNEHVFLIDQHAIHERILYEEAKKKLKKLDFFQCKQELLIYQNIQLNDIKHIDCIINHSSYLKKIGFEWEIINNEPFLITLKTFPNIIDKVGAEEMFFLALNSFEIKEDFIYERLYADIACKCAIKSGYKMTNEEIISFLELINDSNNIAQCNHGRPTYVKIAKNKILDLFERK
ncbi:DNA mismatch repair endonuclease MutL [Anaplasmataceae bacterium AB001_6]|nr:DNA mismatch repair endonuclease MutL [Anaplasmataceae bacterium AB001_6]